MFKARNRSQEATKSSPIKRLVLFSSAEGQEGKEKNCEVMAKNPDRNQQRGLCKRVHSDLRSVLLLYGNRSIRHRKWKIMSKGYCVSIAYFSSQPLHLIIFFFLETIYTVISNN
jgi:hypothetical protein